MKVKAIRTGFYAGQRIRPGVEFDCAEAHLPLWVVPVEEPVVVEPVIVDPVVVEVPVVDEPYGEGMF